MNKPNLLILSPFPIYPTQNGGALRVFNLGMQLSKFYSVTVYCQSVNFQMIKERVLSGKKYDHIDISRNFTIYQSYNLFYNMILFITSRIHAGNIFSGLALKIYTERILKELSINASIVQVEQPWQGAWANTLCEKKNIPLIFSSYGIEQDILRYSVLNIPILKQILIKFSSQLEVDTYTAANLSIHISSEDQKYFNEISPKSHRSEVIPPFSEYINKDSSKQKMKASIRNILFIGSNWRPNIEAVSEICKIAKSFENDQTVKFLVVGSVGQGYKNTSNLNFTGKVDSIATYLHKADIFINPMMSGSGINIKMIDALSAGLPIISTQFGARSMQILHRHNAIICTINEFTQNISELLSNTHLQGILSRNAKATANKYYAKNKILTKINHIYTFLLKSL